MFVSHSSVPYLLCFQIGGLAQLGERSLHTREVAGSSPVVSTTSSERVTLVPIFFGKNQSPAPLFLLFRKKPRLRSQRKKHSLLPRSVFSFSLAYHFFAVTAARFVAKTKVQIRLIISHIEFMDFLEIITIFEIASTSSKRVTLVPIFFGKNQSPAPLFLLFRKKPRLRSQRKKHSLLPRSVFSFSLAYHFFAVMRLRRHL